MMSLYTEGWTTYVNTISAGATSASIVIPAKNFSLKTLYALPYVFADVINNTVKSTGSSVTAGITSYQYRIGNTLMLSTSVTVPGGAHEDFRWVYVPNVIDRYTLCELQQRYYDNWR
jgi:hypothetical protein